MSSVRYCFTALFLFIAILSFSQERRQPFYLPVSAEGLTDVIENKQDDYYRFLKDTLGRRNSKDFKEVIKEDYEKKINSDYFNFDPAVLDMVRPVLKNVYSTNPSLQNLKHLWLVSNDPSPNARANGAGIIIINIGLLFTLEDEAELAFVICHEIAHYTLEHSTATIAKWSETSQSDEFKDQLDEAKNNREVGSKLALKLLDELKTSMRYHSIEKENEADQTGYEYFINTKYDSLFAAAALSKLLRHSERIKTERFKLDGLLATSSYKFKPYWIKEEVSLFSASAEVNDYSLASDTISTHPDLENRIAVLSPGSEDSRFRESNTSNQDQLDVALKSIQILTDLGKIDHSLRLLTDLYLDQRISEQKYYSLLTGGVFEKAIEMKKNHELGRKVPPSSSDAKFKDLNLIRVFLNNISLSQLEKLNIALQKQHKLIK